MDRHPFIDNGIVKDGVTDAVWQLLKDDFPTLPVIEFEVRLTVNGYRLTQQSINESPKKPGRLYAKSIGEVAREIVAELLKADELREHLRLKFVEDEPASTDRQSFNQLRLILAWLVEHPDGVQQRRKSTRLKRSARILIKRLSPFMAEHKLMLPDICWAYAAEIQCKKCDPLIGHLNRLISATDFWVSRGGKPKRRQFAKQQFVSQILHIVDSDNAHPVPNLIRCFEKISVKLAPLPGSKIVDAGYDLGGEDNIKRYIRLHRS